APITTASFSVGGTYLLQLTASDGALSTTALVSIIVNPGAPGNIVIDPSRTITWQGNVGILGGMPIRATVRDCVNDNYIGKGTFYRSLKDDDGPAILACIN